MIYKECWREKEKCISCLICPLLTLLCNDWTAADTNQKCSTAEWCTRGVYLSFWFFKLWAQTSKTWIYLLCLVLSDSRHSQLHQKLYFSPCPSSLLTGILLQLNYLWFKWAEGTQQTVKETFSKYWKYTPSCFGTSIKKGTNTNCLCILVLFLLQVIRDVCKPTYEIKAFLVLQNTVLILTHESWLALPCDWLLCYHNYHHAVVVPQMLYTKTQETASHCPREWDITTWATNTGRKEKQMRRKRLPHLKVHEMCFS